MDKMKNNLDYSKINVTELTTDNLHLIDCSMPDTSKGKYLVNVFRDRLIDQMEKESFHAENDMWSGQVVALEDVDRILRGAIG